MSGSFTDGYVPPEDHVFAADVRAVCEWACKEQRSMVEVDWTGERYTVCCDDDRATKPTLEEAFAKLAEIARGEEVR